MNVVRTVVLSPVEPALLSMKLDSGISNQIDVTYRDFNGNALTTDLAGYLYLVGRTSARAIMYPLFATDVVNGKARAVIPAGDIVDPNGYNLQIIGTSKENPRLIARGSVTVNFTEALGKIPFDEIDDVDLTLAYNDPVEIEVAIWKDTNGGAIYDLTAENVSIIANVYDNQGGIALTSFTVFVIDANHVRLSLTEAQVNTLPARCWWVMRATGVVGVTTLAEGSVTISGTAIPSLAEVTYNWAYTKPPAASGPITGQAVQCGVTLDRLDIYRYDADSIDRMVTFQAIAVDDQIQIDTQVWTVQGVLPGAAYYSFIVTPAIQAAVSGVQGVTFRRP